MWTDQQALLKELDESDWTCNCGHAVDAHDVRVVSTWKHAIALATGEDAFGVLLEHANRIRDDVRARDREAYRGWNTAVISVRPSVRSIVERKLSPDALGRAVPRKFVDHVDWIVLHAAVELHYATHTTMRAHVTLASWMTRGHLPLAWEGGIFPTGRPVVH